jgi:hypothetical protein
LRYPQNEGIINSVAKSNGFEPGDLSRNRDKPSPRTIGDFLPVDDIGDRSAGDLANVAE